MHRGHRVTEILQAARWRRRIGVRASWAEWLLRLTPRCLNGSEVPAWFRVRSFFDRIAGFSSKNAARPIGTERAVEHSDVSESRVGSMCRELTIACFGYEYLKTANGFLLNSNGKSIPLHSSYYTDSDAENMTIQFVLSYHNQVRIKLYYTTFRKTSSAIRLFTSVELKIGSSVFEGRSKLPT
jgi:hypothetical protein